MPAPSAPVINGLEPYEIVFGENQRGVQPLHTLRKADGCVVSRWRLTDKERHDIYHGDADVFVFQHSYFQPPMPLDVQILPSALDVDQSKFVLGLDAELNHRIATGDPYKSPDMLIIDRRAILSECPRQFGSSEEYYDTLEAIKLEHQLRPADRAEMDFDEWQLAEIVRLRGLLAQYVKTV